MKNLILKFLKSVRWCSYIKGILITSFERVQFLSILIISREWLKLDKIYIS